MEVETNDGQVNLTAEEMETLEKTEVDFSDDEKALFEEETTKKVDSLSAQKKHWREKAKKFEEENKKVLLELEGYKNPKEKKKLEDKKPLKQDEEMSSVKAELQEIRLQQSNPNLQSDQIKKVIAWSKADGTEPQDFIKSDFFQAYLETNLKKQQADKSTPNPSNRSGGSFSNFDNVTPDEIKRMDDSTFEKYTKYLETTEEEPQGSLRLRRMIKM